MDDRLRKVEHELSEVKNDIKMQRQILSSINDTLKEMKEANKNMHEIDKKLVHIGNNIESMNAQIKVLFKYKDDYETRMRTVEKNDGIQGVKLGGGEKIFWIGLSAIVGIIVAVVKSEVVR